VTQVKRMGLKDLGKVLNQDLRSIRERAIKATRPAADLGRLVAWSNAPVAFGELREGLEARTTAKGARIRSTAPHSAAVEQGSRPHMPPLGPILEWVRLRGTQGVDVAASGGKPRGHAGNVSTAIAAQGNATSTPTTAALAVARAIQLSIAANGTKPTWFMRRSVPEVEKLYDGVLRGLLEEQL
jgi:hypothetical protein